jgi:peptidoglycan/xylan/chitin deacetylase (PgdA/CDA1 family)
VPGAAADAARKVRANELGVVPVLMYHQIRADGGGPFDLTPAQFRAELGRLYRDGYRPIRAADLATGDIDVPAGKSPVVLTFDDSTKEQLAWDASRRPKPETAIAILQEFAGENPDFEPTGTFYVNRDPFAGVPEGNDMLRWLHDEGWELGNHTRDHIPFTGMSPEEVQRQLVLGKELIVEAVPDAEVRTLALPLGVLPNPAVLARRGSWRGRSYEHAGVFLVGAEPAPSPFSRAFEAGEIPRIRTAPPDAADGEFGSTYWLDELRRTTGLRFVSDGDPATISFPRGRGGDLAREFRSRATPY